MDTHVLLKLLDAATSSRDLAYAPYSNFRVGAAVLEENGTIFTGCNIENSSLGLTVCAERVAIFNAISTGHRRIKAVGIVSDGIRCFPCGACLQVIYEFSKDSAIVVGDGHQYIVKKLSELLPVGFNLENALKEMKSS
jgi:cytidine deaminase